MYYGVTIISLERFKVIYDETYPELQKTLNLSYGKLGISEKESAYDWVVTQGVMNVVQTNQHVRINNHYKHDLYRCIYDHFSFILEHEINIQLKRVNIQFENSEIIKIMVTGVNIFIGKGYVNNV